MAVDTRRLKYFVQVADNGSLSRAAEVLHIAQPALSRQIHLFEEYLGFPLFVRTGRGMQLTKEGEYLRDGVVGPLRDLELAVENMRSFMSRQEDFKLGIGIDTALAPVLAGALTTQLEKHLPGVRFSILEGPSLSLTEWLKRGTVDFALLDQPVTDDGLSLRLLCREDLMLVMRNDAQGGKVNEDESPDRITSPLTINDLRELPLILPSVHLGIRKIVDEAFKQARIAFNIVFETDSLTLVCQLINEGRGVAILPKTLAGMICRDHGFTLQTIDLPVLKSGVYLANRSYGEIEGSLITKMDRTIKETVIDLLADKPTP